MIWQLTHLCWTFSLWRSWSYCPNWDDSRNFSGRFPYHGRDLNNGVQINPDLQSFRQGAFSFFHAPLMYWSQVLLSTPIGFFGCGLGGSAATLGSLIWIPWVGAGGAGSVTGCFFALPPHFFSSQVCHAFIKGWTTARIKWNRLVWAQKPCRESKKKKR